MIREWQEKELENFVKQDISHLARILSMGSDDFELIGTQIQCVLGRMDMLCTCQMTLYVIEFKAIKATEKELGQVLRYCSMLQKVVDPYQHITDHSAFKTIADRVFYQIQPVIVAPEFDKTLFLSDCMLIKALKLGNDNFSLSVAESPFKWKEVEHQNELLRGLLRMFEKSIVGRAIGELISFGIK